MPLGEIRKNTDTEEVSQKKQSKAEKKSTTPRQRAIKALGVATAALLFSDQMIRATGAESSNQAKEVADRMRLSVYQNQAEGYVPSPQQIEQARRWYEERGLPFDSPPDAAQGTSKEGTSQAAEKLSNLRETRGIHLKKKVSFAQRESAKRLYEARHLLQSTNSTNVTSVPVSCYCEPRVWGQKGSATFNTRVVCNGVYSEIRATADVQLSIPGGWQLAKSTYEDCRDKSDCTVSGGILGQSGQYMRTLNGWRVLNSDGRRGTAPLPTIGGPVRID
jgi:hypothetical protein